MHQTQVTKKSVTQVFNFWACKEDVECQDELVLQHVETSVICACYNVKKKKEEVWIAHEL